MTATTGTRSYYVDDLTDEMLPCEATLEGWAEYLVGEGAALDGDILSGSALFWRDDIVATRTNGEWSLSHQPKEDEFCAVRFTKGSGWFPDNIVMVDFDIIAGEVVKRGTLGSAITDWLEDNDGDCDDVEYIAVGAREKWQFMFRADPPHLYAKRLQ